MACDLVVSGELVSLEFTVPGVIVAPEESFESLRGTLESDLSDVARSALGSEDVEVKLDYELGSLELIAVITCAKLVSEVGGFLSGLREIRRLFPQRIRDRLSTHWGGNFAVLDGGMELRDGLLHGKSEEPAAKPSGAAATDLSLLELGAYAGLALVVLVVIAAVVIGGVAAFVES